MALEPGDDEKFSHDWMLDSRCSRHMTPDKNLFITMIFYCKPVRIANGERVYSEGLGDVEVTIDGEIIKMSDVLYVPFFDSNLLSISALNQKGLAVLFKGNAVKILQKQTCIATGVMKGQTYFLESSQVAMMSVDNVHASDSSDTIDTTEATKSVQLSNKESCPTKTWLWHARFGHASLCRLLSYDLERFTANAKDFQCTVCNFSKLTRSVNRKPPERQSTPL